MIAHILKKPSITFAGVQYNTNKVDRNTGELMLIANFGPLQALNNPRPQDLVNYLQVLAAQHRNKGLKNTQFHAVISANGRNYNKHELTKAAVMWLKEMKYGEQPYLIVFHKDTENHHLHVVSSRVDRQGKLIDRDYEHVRSVRSLDKVLGYTFALQYQFSTKAQFYLILENQGYLGRDYLHEKKLASKIAGYVPDKTRMAELKELFLKERHDPAFIQRMHDRYQVDIILHGADGKKPYGYTVIDHATKRVLKGSEILSLKYLLDENIEYIPPKQRDLITLSDLNKDDSLTYSYEYQSEPVHIQPVMIADDIDDQQVLGMKRRRQKKARTNTR
ncbi:relaxase/mobilization nuclease domain-containing protein [Mucilaginibacter psychrotolerans]|uniref:MobA/VirD2-like nuclease domain-containing protein n=1 Tax=Mucilaginibacter psychrotolerans TaxID=1524096 RepID=A0A4Y8SGZ1_9SPHI|nr:relaxase/mobilization nuclease domain-containing protein [Mucilaginibacter psychrotolerans]TFF37686.1 hypothetical protein E2R66_10990 [Mucilaginibacter psychrotolerans]